MSDQNMMKNTSIYMLITIWHCFLKIRTSNNYEINLFKLTKEFIQQVIKSKKWEKWCYQEDIENVKFLSSSHYFFNSDIYKEIYSKVSKEFDIENLIIKKHFDILNNFYI